MTDKQAQSIISDFRLKRGSGDVYAPIIRWDEFEVIISALEDAEKRIEEGICRANREHHRGFMMACNHLKEHANIHYADAAEMEIAALRQRINELEARTITVKFAPIPMEELGNRRDGKKHPYMFGAGYNSAVVHCESVLHQACAAAGIGVKGE